MLAVALFIWDMHEWYKHPIKKGFKPKEPLNRNDMDFVDKYDSDDIDNTHKTAVESGEFKPNTDLTPAAENDEPLTDTSPPKRSHKKKKVEPPPEENEEDIIKGYFDSDTVKDDLDLKQDK